MRRRATLVLAAAGVATGCARIPLPIYTLGAADQFANAPIDAPTAWPDAEWWRGFGSAELDALILAAREHNQDLRGAAERVLQAEAGARIDAAPLFPWLDLDGGASRRRGSTGGSTSLSVGGTVSWDADLWGRLRANARAGEADLLASGFDRDALALSITAATAATYFQLVAIRARRDLAAETLVAARRILGIVQAQAGAGGASELDIQRQLSAVASQEAQLADLTGQEAQQRHALAVLLGRRPDQLAVAARSLAPLRLPPVEAGLPTDLLARRPDLARAEAQLVSAGFDAEAARAARYPGLRLTVSADRLAPDLAGLFTMERLLTVISASILAPVFQGGRLAAAEDRATARMRELGHSYAAAILTAFREVEDALAVSRAARESHALRRTAYEAAQRAYAIAELRWNAGDSDFITVLQAQQAFLAATDQLSQADLTRYLAAVALYRALGGGWSRPAELAARS
ncbi:efflux transporter outer membrane subunit [Elioraea tepidiphila]|uniref:efflux transporter outer membrane subunit n=1 Tax=Elioraea tepidiphila TaxID=457934 RepID=UPI002FD93801